MTASVAESTPGRQTHVRTILGFEEWLSPAALKVYQRHCVSTVEEIVGKDGSRTVIRMRAVSRAAPVDAQGQPPVAIVCKLARAMNRLVESGAVGWGTLLPASTMEMAARPLVAVDESGNGVYSICTATGFVPEVSVVHDGVRRAVVALYLFSETSVDYDDLNHAVGAELFTFEGGIVQKNDDWSDVPG